MGKLLPISRNVKLPTFLRITWQEFESIYPYWLIWQAVDRKPSEFLVAMRMPSAFLDGLLELDDLFDRLSKINAERIAKEEEAIKGIR